MGAEQPLEGIRTQVSGKYSPDNQGLFDFRRRLAGLGMDVRFPAGDSILAYEEGFAITVPDEAATPFHQTELAFLDSVKRSDLHIVYDRWGNEDGYVGESTALETILALEYTVPTVWLRPPGRLSPHIGRHLKIFTERACDIAWDEPLEQMDDSDLARSIGRLASRQTGVQPWAVRPNLHKLGYFYWDGNHYNWPVSNDFEEELLMDLRHGLLDKYWKAWQRTSWPGTDPNKQQWQ